MSRIGGDWDVSLQTGLKCCPEDVTDDDIILLSTRYKRRGMLKRFSLEICGQLKGVSPLEGATVYIVRLGKHADRRMARPCASCWRLLKNNGVKWVIYTTDGGWERERM